VKREINYINFCAAGFGGGMELNMKAEIIAVGTEILLGQIVNTNAQYIAKELSELGIDLYYQTVVGDNPERLKSVLNIAFGRADMVILTGGLGPTNDDLTKETVAEYFGLELEMHEQSLNEIKSFFERLGREMTENNRKQAMIPKGAVVLKNDNGTAPGCIVSKDGKTAILLPGPPKEMAPLFDSRVAPYIKSGADSVIVSRSLRIFGKGESSVEALVRDLMNSSNPTVAPYAKEGEVELRVTAKTESEEKANLLINEMIEKLKSRIGEFIYGYDEDSLASVTVSGLKKKGLTLSTAESCTGGLIAGTITSVAGSSDVFGFGYTTYANEAKAAMLGVNKETLDKFGAVSEEVAKEMAAGAKKNSGSSIGVSATGIAGPGGGTSEKPVGLVYIALADDNGVICKKLNLTGNRERIRGLTVMNVLDMIRRRVN